VVAKLAISKQEIVDDARFAVETFCNFLLTKITRQNEYTIQAHKAKPTAVKKSKGRE